MLAERTWGMIFERPIPDFLEKHFGVPDARVEGWPGLKSPSTVFLLYFVYGLIITGGRKFMKFYTAFELKGILVFYNVLQIVLSAYIFGEVMACVQSGDYSLTCASEKMDHSSMRLARAVWLFYLSKMIDLMDTVFFVLRKKDEQMTFLHVYHHMAMLLAWYLGALYTPGGQAWLSVAINTGIHVLMYSYYLVAALGPRYRKYLWWKRYLTQLQLIQFFIVGGQVAYLLYNGCARPTWLAHVAFFYNITLILLFFGFYRKAYPKIEARKFVEKNAQSERWVEKWPELKKRS